MTERIFGANGLIVKSFPNGFQSWQQAHGVINMAIGEKLERGNVTEQMDEYLAMRGQMGLLQLAEQLTDQFEAKYKDVAWDVDTDPETGKEYDFYDAIDAFINNYL